MKRLLFVAAVVVMLMSSSAQANLIVTTNRSVFNANLDLVEFYVDELTELDAGKTIGMLEGTWTAGEGTTMYLQESFGDFWTLFTSTTGASMPPQSFVNFDGLSSSGDTQYWGRDGSGTDYNNFSGSWYANSSSNWSEGSLIAKIYVTTGGEVSFSGKYESTYNGGTAFDTTFSSVPEPSTLVLLGLGLAGLLLCVWKRS